MWNDPLKVTNIYSRDRSMVVCNGTTTSLCMINGVTSVGTFFGDLDRQKEGRDMEKYKGNILKCIKNNIITSKTCLDWVANLRKLRHNPGSMTLYIN